MEDNQRAGAYWRPLGTEQGHVTAQHSVLKGDVWLQGLAAWLSSWQAAPCAVPNGQEYQIQKGCAEGCQLYCSSSSCHVAN